MTQRTRRTAGWFGLLLVLLGPLGPLASAVAQTTLRDDRGATLRLAGTPQRIVSLLPSLTESVCALGGCERLVATDRYSNWPASVLALPKVGGLDDAQIERIVALKPDLVLAAPSARAIDRLEALGVKVLVLDSNSHSDVRRTLITLSEVLGVPDAAQPIWVGIEKQIRDAAARVPPTLQGQRVYFEVETAPYAAGTSSFIGETLTRLGLVNVVPATLGPFPKLSPEFVVRAQPDIVIAAQRNLVDMPRRPGWNALRALQNGRSCGFDSARYELLIRPGPRMGAAADLLADCLVGLARDR